MSVDTATLIERLNEWADERDIHCWGLNENTELLRAAAAALARVSVAEDTPPKNSEGDPDVVHPSDSRAESQAGLNGPSGSPTSPSERASSSVVRRLLLAGAHLRGAGGETP